MIQQAGAPLWSNCFQGRAASHDFLCR